MTDSNNSGTTSIEGNSGAGLVPVKPSELSDQELTDALEKGIPELSDDEDATLDGDSPQNEEQDEDTEETEAELAQKTVSREEYEQLRAKLELQQKQLTNQDAYLKKRDQEIGKLRKERNQLAQEILASRKRIEQQALTTEEEFEERFSLKEKEREFDQLTAQQEGLEQTQAAMEVVSRFMPSGLPVDEIAEMLSKDGIAPEHLEEFKKNPYSVGEAALINMARRAKLEKAVPQLYQVASQAIAELKKLQGKPNNSKREILKGIEKAAKDTSYLNGSSGGSRSDSTVNPADVTRLSDAELEQLLGSRN